MRRYIKLAIMRFANRLGLHLMRYRRSRWGKEFYAERTRPASPRYVNIGPGAFYHPLWHNLDMPSKYYKAIIRRIDFHHDLNSAEPLPFESGSVAIFYTSHVLEHLEAQAVRQVISECFRCLQPGGTFRLVVPDAGRLYRAYVEEDDAFWRTPSPWGNTYSDRELWLAEYVATGSPLLPSDIRALHHRGDMATLFDYLCTTAQAGPDGHRNWFDAAKLIGLLQQAGFEARQCRYLQSSDPRLRDPRLFDATCPELSLYVEARRAH